MSSEKNIKILNPNDPKSMKALIQSKDFYIDTSFTNILRRYIISNIDTYTFYYINKENKNKNIKEIKINKDETKTNINNDMLSHRISLLTVNVFVLEILILFNYYKLTKNLPDIETFEISQEDLYMEELEFKINKSYPSDQSSSDYIDVTEEHIKNDLFDELIEQKDDSDSDAKNYCEKLKENNNLNKIISKYNENTDEFDINKLRLFKPYIFNEKEYYNIITKIKSEQSVNISMYLMKSSVVGDNYTDNNIRYSPVSACRSTFVINYEKVLNLFRENNPNIFIEGNVDINELIKILSDINDNDELKKININGYDDDDEFKIKFNEFKYFCIEEGERYYYGIDDQSKRQHLLEYDTVDFYTPKTILIKGLEALILKNNANKYHNIEIFEMIGNKIPTQYYTINKSSKLENALDILIYNGNHGLGYLMQTYLKYIDENNEDKITYIGYKIIHPLENKLLLTIQSKIEIDDVIEEIISNIFLKTYEYLSELVNKLISELI